MAAGEGTWLVAWRFYFDLILFYYITVGSSGCQRVFAPWPKRVGGDLGGFAPFKARLWYLERFIF